MFGLKPSLLPAALVAAGLAAALTVLALPSDSQAGNRNGITRNARPWYGQPRVNPALRMSYLHCAVEKDWDESGGGAYPIVRLTNNTGVTLAAGTRVYWRMNTGKSAYYVLPTPLQPGQGSMPIDIYTAWSDGLSCTARIVSRKVLRGVYGPAGLGRIGGIHRRRQR